MSRAHKVLNTWFKNRETQQNFATGKSQIPTAAERKADLEAQQNKKNKVDEAVDKEHPIYKEYENLKKHSIKDLRDMIKRQHRIIDTSEFRTKEHAASHILHNRHGATRMKAVFGESLEQFDTVTPTFLSLIESWETEKKKRHLRDALDRHTEKALAANRAGDDEAVRVHQQHMNRIKGQMAKLMRNESIEDIYDTTENQLEVGLDEAWNINNRNPQRAVKVGSKVRSYDFPGMHDDHYVEGHVVGETPHSYHIKVGKVVRGNKEIPTPAHMHHVEAPKGKSLWTDAYAVHKLKEQTETNEQAVAPVEKNYYKGIKLHFAKGNRGGKSSSNKGGAADGGNGGSSGGNGDGA